MLYSLNNKPLVKFSGLEVSTMQNNRKARKLESQARLLEAQLKVAAAQVNLDVFESTKANQQTTARNNQDKNVAFSLARKKSADFKITPEYITAKQDAELKRLQANSQEAEADNESHKGRLKTQKNFELAKNAELEASTVESKIRKEDGGRMLQAKSEMQHSYS